MDNDIYFHIIDRYFMLIDNSSYYEQNFKTFRTCFPNIKNIDSLMNVFFNDFQESIPLDSYIEELDNLRYQPHEYLRTLCYIYLYFLIKSEITQNDINNLELCVNNTNDETERSKIILYEYINKCVNYFKNSNVYFFSL